MGFSTGPHRLHFHEGDNQNPVLGLSLNRERSSSRVGGGLIVGEDIPTLIRKPADIAAALPHDSSKAGQYIKWLSTY